MILKEVKSALSSYFHLFLIFKILIYMQLNRIYFHIRLLFFFFPPLPSTSIDSTLPLQTNMEKNFQVI